jgi:hypothetical protein
MNIEDLKISQYPVAEAVTQGKILPIMLFYRCFIEWKK